MELARQRSLRGKPQAQGEFLIIQFFQSHCLIRSQPSILVPLLVIRCMAQPQLTHHFFDRYPLGLQNLSLLAFVDDLFRCMLLFALCRLF